MNGTHHLIKDVMLYEIHKFQSDKLYLDSAIRNAISYYY